MSTTAQNVFDLAIHLMGEGDESTGATDTTDTTEYKNRTLAILNVLRAECLPLSDTYTVATAGTRPICPLIADFTSDIGLDDGICQTILPYGLAAHLFSGENAALASYFNQRYEKLKASLKIPNAFTEIEDLYGGIEYGQFGSW